MKKIMRCVYLIISLSPIGPQLKSHMIIHIWSVWSETPPINHTNCPSPCNIYDNATNDKALIATIPHLFWWSATAIRKKPVPSRRCSPSIHHLLSFVWWMLHLWGIISVVCNPLPFQFSCSYIIWLLFGKQMQTATAAFKLTTLH